MRLNDEQQQRIIDFMSSAWPSSAVCPMCKSQRWAIKNRVLEVRDYSAGEAEQPRHPAMPLIAITCEHCGYCVLMDAVTLGVVSKPEAGSKEEPAE